MKRASKEARAIETLVSRGYQVEMQTVGKILDVSAKCLDENGGSRTVATVCAAAVRRAEWEEHEFDGIFRLLLDEVNEFEKQNREAAK